MSVRETISTYDRIAAEYTERWRDRSVMKRALAKFTEPLWQGARVLDIGCGPGFDSALLRNEGLHVFGLDLSWGMLRQARRHHPGWYVQADMRRLPLCSGFDGIWCNAALLHLSRADAALALGEFHRVLKDGGILYLAVKQGVGEDERSDAYGADAPRYFTYWQDELLDEALRAQGLRLLDGWADQGEQQHWLCRLAQKPAPPAANG